jgi:hypothetical protein
MILAFGAALAMLSAVSAPARAQDVEQLPLQDTLDVIKGALASQGAVAYQGNVRDTNTGQTWSYTRSITSTDISTDTDNCFLTFHYTVVTNGTTSTDVPRGGIPFKIIAAVEQDSEVAMIARRDAQAGHASWVSSFSPEVYDVVVDRTDGQQNVLSFYSLQVADRVAAAVRHAWRLCSNGSGGGGGGGYQAPQPAPYQGGGGGGGDLGDVMSQIAGAMQSQGDVTYTIYNNGDGQTWQNVNVESWSEITPHPDTCILSYHYSELENGKSNQDVPDSGIPFDKVTGVQVLTVQDDLVRINQEAGHPSWSSRVEPTVWVVEIHRADNAVNEVDFTDRGVADNVADLIRRGASLCHH